MTVPVSEVWAYMVVDPDGDEGVCYVETAGAARVPLLATSREGARALRPLAERTVSMTGLSLTLSRFSIRSDVEVLDARHD